MAMIRSIDTSPRRWCRATSRSTPRATTVALAATAWLAVAAPLHAQSVAAPTPAPAPAEASAVAGPPAEVRTVEAYAGHARLTAGLPNADVVGLRGTWQRASGDVARAEVVEERKFGVRGGVGALSYLKVLDADWQAALALAAGHGGVNWARWRADAEVARSWGADRTWVTRLAAYAARFDAGRSDRGVRLGVARYLDAGTLGSAVLEAGAAFNVSQPGSVDSTMPFVAATLGRDGAWWVSARLARGNEAWSPLVGSQEIVDFRSTSLGASWRGWIGSNWGLTAAAEWYRNPTYRRTGATAGVFVNF